MLPAGSLEAEELHFQTTGSHCNGCIIPHAVKHSLVLLKMGGIKARNMLSWLQLLINRYCCIYLVFISFKCPVFYRKRTFINSILKTYFVVLKFSTFPHCLCAPLSPPSLRSKLFHIPSTNHFSRANLRRVAITDILQLFNYASGNKENNESGNCEGYRVSALHSEDIGKIRMKRQFGIRAE